MSTIESGDKLFLVTRRDLSIGLQAAQACHAMRQFVAEHPRVDCEWFNRSNYLVLLTVADEIELIAFATRAGDMSLAHSTFFEPDFNNQATAIAIEPHKNAAKLCRSLPLLGTNTT